MIDSWNWNIYNFNYLTECLSFWWWIWYKIYLSYNRKTYHQDIVFLRNTIVSVLIDYEYWNMAFLKILWFSCLEPDIIYFGWMHWPDVYIQDNVYVFLWKSNLVERSLQAEPRHTHWIYASFFDRCCKINRND